MASKSKKITAHIPEDILRTAQSETGAGITETLIQGLKILAAKSSYQKLRDLRGKVDLKINYKELKTARE